MNHMKVSIELCNGQDPMEALQEVVKKVKKVSSIKELRALQEEMDSMPYGAPEDMMMKEEPYSEEESPEHEAMPGDVTEDRNEGEQDMTPDDKAENEDKETRIKKSKNPTVVGRMMK